MRSVLSLALVLLFGSRGIKSLEAIKDLKQGAMELLAEAERHQLFMDLNPGCPVKSCHPSNTKVTLANLTVKDTSSDNSPIKHRQQHWIWTLIDHPAIQVALTPGHDEVDVNWAALLGLEDLSYVIKYQPEYPDYSSAIMLANLIEFDDKENLGYLDPSRQEVVVYPLNDFAWNRTVLENTTERVAFQMIGENFTASNVGLDFNITEGRLNLTFSAYALNGFGRWLPHLSHSRSTNQVDIQLQGLKSNSNFNCSRFALEIYLVSDTEKMLKLVRQNTKTLDDEHTPGIFRTQELIIPGYNDTLQAYLQWRPVVYTSTMRDLSASTEVNVTDDVKVNDPNTELKFNILYAFYGTDLNDMLVRKVNVTLGSKGDGFYKKTKYQAWTFTFGTGTPIHNGMSPMIVLVLTVMFGILVIILITSCVIGVIKKIKKKREVSYGRIHD